MTLRSTPLAIVTIVLFVGGIAVSMALNLWETESTKVPTTIRTGEFEGVYDPADIRGSYTFGDVAASFDVSVEILAEAFAVTDVEDPSDFRVNSLEELYGALSDGGEVGTDSVRLFVARYTGIPFEAEETTRLPSPAAPLLKDKLSEEEYSALRTIVVTVGDLRAAAGTVVEGEEHESETDTTIKGKTTFDELLGWGLTKEEIESILGRPMGARSETVRDFISELGLEFADYRTKLQALIDSRVEE